MKIRLYSKPIKEFSPEIQVCLNRGIEPQNINKYLNNSFDNINPPEAFGEELLKSGVDAEIIAKATKLPIEKVTELKNNL